MRSSRRLSRRGCWALALLPWMLWTIPRAQAEECTAPAEWFAAGGTPPPSNARPRPDVDCDFYRWAWQTFLYVTQPAEQGGAPRFLKYISTEQLFGEAAAPRFPLLTAAMKNQGVLLQLSPRANKLDSPASLAEVNQAGSLGMLIDQRGHSVYYGIHLNPVFEKFVRSNGYTDPEKLAAAPADQQFPTGSLEFKSSWVIVPAGEKAAGYFTADAVISKLVNDPTSGIVIDPKATQRVTMALVGLHVVGVVDGHPEFIWATFEHNDNTPDLPPGVLPTDNKPVDATRDWTFYPQGELAAVCNRKSTQSSVPPLTLDPAAQTLSPKTSVMRRFPFGGDDDPSDIVGLNQSVHSQLPAGLDVWKNYSLFGAVWMNDADHQFREDLDIGAVDKMHPEQKLLGGDRQLSNTTMETFTQEAKSCFHCHRTTAETVHGTKPGEPPLVFPAKRIGVSHAITGGWAHMKESQGKAAGK